MIDKSLRMTSEEFFAALQEAWDEIHREDKIANDWHPEDLAVNISHMADTVGYFMSALIKMRRHR